MVELADQARRLILIVRELQELGFNPELVRLDDDGVTQVGLTLCDELGLIAMGIDFAAVVAMETETRS